MTTPATGAGDFTPSSAVASSDVLMDQQTTVTVAAGTSKVMGPYLMTQSSYAVAVDALLNSSGTVGLFRVLLNWSDPATGLQVGEEAWYVSGTTIAGPASAGLTVGRGPTKAGQLTVFIHNYDPADAITVDWAIWQSSRVVTRDDWRGLAQSGGYLTYTVPASESPAGVLGWADSATVAGNSGTTWQCALYAGAVNFSWLLTVATGVAISIFVPLADRPSTNWPTLWALGSPPVQGQLVLPFPRCPVLVECANSNAGATVFTWAASIQEFAS